MSLMNKRNYDKEGKFYCFEPPWYYENFNIIYRSKQLYDSVSEMERRVGEIKDFFDNAETREEAESNIYELYSSVELLLREFETFKYVFPYIVENEWYHDPWQDFAGAYWRLEEEGWGRKRGISMNLQDGLNYFSGPHNTIKKFYGFLENLGNELPYMRIDDEFEEDVDEIKNLYSIGYYRTSLLVLGRTIEKCLLMIGKERKIVSVDFHSVMPWEETSFSARAKALKDVNMPESNEKVISKRQYHNIQIMIDHRNNVAHSDYENIEKEVAINKIESGFRLLKELDAQLEKLQDIEDPKIHEVHKQNVS